ncbi:MAG: hypothetical protein ABFS16_01350 [Bacteroidota bacterium]
MSARILNLPKVNLLERKYIPSRIACFALSALLILYLIPRPDLIAPLIIAGSLTVLLIIQFFYQNPIMNILLGSAMALIGAYFCLAVIDEFLEFETVTQEAWRLLLFGLGLFLSVIFLSVLMIRRAILD